MAKKHAKRETCSIEYFVKEGTPPGIQTVIIFANDSVGDGALELTVHPDGFPNPVTMRFRPGGSYARGRPGMGCAMSVGEAKKLAAWITVNTH